jgi:ribonucleotide reductase beta subunit family protein with ferritin-like domain
MEYLTTTDEEYIEITNSLCDSINDFPGKSSTSDKNDIEIENNKYNSASNTRKHYPISSKSSLLEDYDEEMERKLDKDESILDPKNERLFIHPRNPTYDDIWELYKKQQECYWTAEEINFSKDYENFVKHDEDTQNFIKMTLAFFAGADSIVVTNIKERLGQITIKEIDITYGFQQMMENVHTEVYGLMLENIVKDPNEREKLTNAFKNVNSIKMMIEWAQNWTASKRRIGFIIMAYIIFEGLMFSGQFASIYWLKYRSKNGMTGLFDSNELIARDEGMHTMTGVKIYNKIKHRLSESEAFKMMDEAVDISKQFFTDSLTIDLIGMNTRMMNQYIEYCADRLLVYTDYSKKYNASNPFNFMETMGFINKANFFEKRVTEYSKAYSKDNSANWEFKIIDDY